MLFFVRISLQFVFDEFRNFLQGSLEPKISNSPDILNPKLNYAKGAWILEFELRINPESKDGINLLKNPYHLVHFPGGGKIGTDSKLGKLLNETQYSINRIRFVKAGGTLLRQFQPFRTSAACNHCNLLAFKKAKT